MAKNRTQKVAENLTHRALTPIRHDGNDYAIGEGLQLSDDQAEPLLAVKAVEPIGNKE